ncbi:acyltransferase family protein [Streptomyces boncukensis]|uniref:Acyltransferase n=1 Tax=Streptomyces boncukensis TaxID=2711219 RepID=A0A6G4X5G4_9ACTN|nr:acyltransferase family protein [Streptomyces boncukensis]NGO72779.1 acyltransferase [Streptomyces boncukensis]
MSLSQSSGVPRSSGLTESGSGPRHAGRTRPGRDRYLDLLRALALLRVVAYHTFGWAWLTLVFPSMGVMFALAGSLMAHSLARPALQVIKSRVRRLLPPLWLFGAVALTALVAVQGWRPGLEVLRWLVPVGAPPYPESAGSEGGLLERSWALQAAGPLWYLRAYLWFVLLSPVLLRAFRRLPWATLLAPLALTALIDTGVLRIPGETGEAVKDFAVYGSCWVLGFAHREGLLRRLPGYVIPSLAPFVMAAGAWWAHGHLGPDGWDLNDIPLGQALWSFGFCLLLLHFSPSWQRLPGVLGRFDPLITLANARAVTIYLWHEIALIATVPLIDKLWQIDAVADSPTLSSWLEQGDAAVMFVLVWPLLALLVVAFGWAEDVAARRKPRLFPVRG